MESITCQLCGATIERKAYGPSPRWCSTRCRVTASYVTRKAEGRIPQKEYKPRPKVERTCQQCGTVFAGRPDARFCGEPCRNRAFYEARIADGRQGELNDKRRKHEPRACCDCGKRMRIGIRCRDCSQALRKNIGGPATQAAARLRVFERDRWICQICFDGIDRRDKWPSRWCASIDHKVPLRDCLERFGPDYVDTEDNWQAAHARCNQRKGARALGPPG